MTKFSIIIPVYNVAPYLRECLKSVVCNVERLKGCKVEKLKGCGVEKWDVEIICVDDGSTDGSGAILDEYASHFNSSTFQPFNFKVIHQANGGVGAARNVGLDLARGDWLLFLDADDMLTASALKVLADCSDSHPDADIIRFGAVTFTDGTVPEPAHGEVQEAECADVNGLCASSDLRGTCWQHAYRRGNCADVRFADYSMGEDRLYHLQCLLRASRLVSTSATCYAYRIRRESASHRPPTRRHVLGEMGFAKDFLTLLWTSGRAVDLKGDREYSTMWFEKCVYNLFRLPADERAEAWGDWLRELEAARALRPCFTLWRNLMIEICYRLPFRPVAWLLGAMPYGLKRMGIHR